MTTKIFPCLLIALDIGAAVVYGISGDWRKVIYWIAAAVLMLCDECIHSDDEPLCCYDEHTPLNECVRTWMKEETK